MLELTDGQGATSVPALPSMSDQIAKDAALAMMLQSEESESAFASRGQMETGAYLDFLQRSAIGLGQQRGGGHPLLDQMDRRAADHRAEDSSSWLPSLSAALGQETLLDSDSMWEYARRSDDEDEPTVEGEDGERVLKGGAFSRRGASGGLRRNGNSKIGLHRRTSWQPSSIPVD